MSAIRNQIFEELSAQRISVSEFCSDKENKQLDELVESGKPLPPNVTKPFMCESYQKIDFSSDGELTNFLLLKAMKTQNTIKKCAVFFAALTVINIIVSIIAILS